MEYKDYYKILGIEKTATAEQIKKAYKKLAIKYHPDKNPGDKTAETRFKEINEANQILGNPDKRRKYDEMGENWDQFQPQGGANQGGRPAGGFGGGGFDPSAFGESGQFSDFFEAFFGGNGGGFGGSSRRRGATRRKGSDMIAEIQISLKEAFNGSSYPVSIDGSSLNLKLRPGLAEGQRLRLKGKGSEGMNGGENGDLIITVHITKDPVFERNENDLHFDQPMDLYTAVLGGKVDVKGIDKTVRIDVSAGTDGNKILRLKGMGMPLYDKPEERGYAYVRLILETPKNLSEKEQTLFKELAALRS